MKALKKTVIATTLLVAAAFGAQASSHREALAVLNEPCADNTDTYAWVQNGSHDKLYLIMNSTDFTNPARATRACVRATAIATSFTSVSAKVSSER